MRVRVVGWFPVLLAALAVGAGAAAGQLEEPGTFEFEDKAGDVSYSAAHPEQRNHHYLDITRGGVEHNDSGDFLFVTIEVADATNISSATPAWFLLFELSFDRYISGTAEGNLTFQAMRRAGQSQFTSTVTANAVNRAPVPLENEFQFVPERPGLLVFRIERQVALNHAEELGAPHASAGEVYTLLSTVPAPVTNNDQADGRGVLDLRSLTVRDRPGEEETLPSATFTPSPTEEPPAQSPGPAFWAILVAAPLALRLRRSTR